MTRSTCRVLVRLIGILILGTCLPTAWHSACVMFFERVWFNQYWGWLWPFTSYDQGALDDLGNIAQFGLGLALLTFPNPIVRQLVRGSAKPGECDACGYHLGGATRCPECGEATK